MKNTINANNGKLKLNCYASGSGSLSFTWAENVHPYKASSLPVTRDHVERFLNLKNNKGKYLGHQIAEVHPGDWELIPIVERVLPNMLAQINHKGEREEYLYKIGGNPDFQDETVIHYNNVMFLTEIKYNEYVKVNHIATRLRLVFFLKNESLYNKLKETVTAS